MKKEKQKKSKDEREKYLGRKKNEEKEGKNENVHRTIQEKEMMKENERITRKKKIE